MGRSIVEGDSDFFAGGETDEIPEHQATVDDFALDKYEVTVGRFRKFIENYDTWRAAGNPTNNAGMHPKAPYTGWGMGWIAVGDELPADSITLVDSIRAKYGAANSSYVDGNNDAYPLNWVNWYLAFAFCIWDGGRLPTEAEWEYSAAGGSENRMFPWGSEAPDTSRANYSGSDRSPFVVVGSKGRGAGRWGHLDLAGSMDEWTFDVHSSSMYGTAQTPVRCDNCANAADSGGDYRRRVIRGGSWWLYSTAEFLRVSSRGWSGALAGNDNFTGVRCARTP